MTDRTASNEAILVLGAGQLGMAVWRGLVDRISAQEPASVTVLLRPPSNDRASLEQGGPAAEVHSMGVDVVHADLAKNSVGELAEIFARFDTVICCTGFVAGRGTQRKLTAAVLEAGVGRYVPWQFGVDYDVVGRGSGQDVWDEQIDVRDMLRAQTRTRWIIVSTGIFTPFLFEPAFGVVDLARNRVHALGRWDHKVTVTTPADIGRLTAAILSAQPAIVDAVVHVAGDTLSYAELADMLDGELGRTLDRVEWTAYALASDAAAHPSDDMRKYRLAFARDDGVAWDKARTFNARNGIAVTDVRSWIRVNPL